MIQRIQSLFLSLAIVALVLMFVFPLAFFYGANGNLSLYACRIAFFDPTPSIQLSPYYILPLLSIAVFTIILLLASLFSFKNRRRQLQINRVSILLILAYIATFFFAYVQDLEKLTEAVAAYQIGSVMPLAAFILVLLANRWISKDEKLIRSMDRIR